MRAILLLLILLVVGVIAAVATGFLDIDQTRSAEVPNISTSREGVVAQGGQTPKFEVDTGSVAIGKGEATVPVPRLEVRPAPDNGQVPAQQPQPATTNSTQP
jgi:hypothetical protein